jgi:hypothetical protein
MTKIPKLHPISIGHVLEKAEFPKSKWLASSRVRGWGHSTEGFRIKTEYGTRRVWHQSSKFRHVAGMGYFSEVSDLGVIKGITLTWVFGDWFSGDYDAQQKKQFEGMTNALRDAGYEVDELDETLILRSQRFLRIRVPEPKNGSL